MANPLHIFAFADEASPDLNGQIEAMRRNGLDGLEIRGVDGENISDISPKKAREVRERLDGADLKVWSIGSPIGKIGMEEPLAPHLDKLRRTVELAHILGAQNIRMFSFYIPRGAQAADFRQAAIDRVGAMLAACEGSGVALCHENEKGIYGDTAGRCLELLTAFPQLQGVFDPANFVQCGQDTWQAWTMLAPRTKYLHIKDALRDGTVVPAGRGEGNVARIVAAFRAQSGAHVTVEPHLQVFSGLEALEQAGARSGVGAYAYASADEAFDAACAALRALI